MDGIREGDTVSVSFTALLDNGRILDSADETEPFSCVIGHGDLLLAVEEAMVGMEPGQVKDVRIEPSQAFGTYLPQLVFTVDITDIPPTELPGVGEKRRVRLPGEAGVMVTIMRTTENRAVVDGNHPLVGKFVNYSIKVLDIEARAENSEEAS